MSNRATPRSLDENAVIRRLSLVSLIGNALLSGFKLLAGVWGHSGAMISDAIHSFSDVLITFVALRKKKKNIAFEMTKFAVRYLQAIKTENGI